MGYREITLDYYDVAPQDLTLLLRLDANSVGNSNATWEDTSSYATNAIQINIPNQPILTPDLFGSGNYGYIFSYTKYMNVTDSDRFTFSDGLADSPFTIKMTVIFNSQNANFFLTKMDNGAEWRILYISGYLYIQCYDNDQNNFIYAGKQMAFTVGEIYELKFTYDGSSSSVGFEIYINNILQSGIIRGSLGSYVTMHNSISPVSIGQQQGSYSDMSLALVEIYNTI